MLQNNGFSYGLVSPKVSKECIKQMEEIVVIIFTPMLFNKKQPVKVVILYCVCHSFLHGF